MKDDGGGAFPLAPCGTGDPRDGMAGGSTGMSLRDYFAGQALAGLIGSQAGMISLKEYAREAGFKPAEYMAETLYGFADAMILERSKPCAQ